FSDSAGRLHHGVGAVRDDDLILLALATRADDHGTLSVGHLEAVDHHERLPVDVQPASSAPQHLVDVRVPEVQPAAQLVVFLVEGAAGDEDANAHARECRGYSNVCAKDSRLPSGSSTLNSRNPHGWLTGGPRNRAPLATSSAWSASASAT